MRASIRAMLLAACAAIAISACGGSSAPDTELDWDQGNWDEQDWQ